MKVTLIYLTLVSVLLDITAANPLIANETLARTFTTPNMKCNTRSSAKRVTLSHSVIYDSNSQNCAYTIRAFSTRVCQLRVDFLYFDLDQPTASRRPYASCEGDHLTINGLNFDLCGILVNQHVYVPFDVQRLTDELVLDFQIGSNKFAIWNMEVNQIECSHKAALVTPDERQAPDGCLQYFYHSNGQVQSFNFGHNYFGNTQYAICFNRNYNPNAILELEGIDFNMDGNLGGGTPPGFDNDCLDSSGAAANNKKDYIAIPFAAVTDPAGPVVYHSLFCLQSLDSKILEFSGTGPMVIHVNTDQITDATANEEGFRFRYQVRRR
ncbi:uncharacterized protein LOC119080265 isoform X2 [Bradysia coprophila]|uniref:uncharacterized protein LOC119080265 isoform X2 n=1 Tax=Bradysia coprophila TaxID=38358 RepID=UPI00187D9CA6|nr:uncharacterized protein LOC119080265 isoform X2 [Bradysia coprophila]